MGDCTSAPMASNPDNGGKPMPTGKMTSNQETKNIELKDGLEGDMNFEKKN